MDATYLDSFVGNSVRCNCYALDLFFIELVYNTLIVMHASRTTQLCCDISISCMVIAHLLANNVQRDSCYNISYVLVK